jgi:glucose-6-phosphate 1-dehydrogenase
MEPPIAFDADSVRKQTLQVFLSIRPMSVEDIARSPFELSMVPEWLMGSRYRGIGGSQV